MLLGINFAYQLQEFLVNFWTYLIPLFCGGAIKVMLDRFRTENVLRKAQEAQLSRAYALKVKFTHIFYLM
jgi:hypothetical protein